jgi:quinol monooxygenase YgiN
MYVEVAPAATSQAAGLLRTYREAARKETGALRTEIFEEAGTPSRFVSNEVWRTQADYDAHKNAPASTELSAKLTPVQFGPPDARVHVLHFSAKPGAASALPANGVFIISHLDVTPPQLPTLLELMKPLAENSAKEPGVLAYEILRQGARGNHFRLFEVWASEKAWEDHNFAGPTQAFRNKVAPYLGTPYDQRKYVVLK